MPTVNIGLGELTIIGYSSRINPLITVILSQPSSLSINAAYRPILIKAQLPNAMPIVFCDIYFNTIYYKTLSKTSPGLEPEFDIQDAAQEYLSTDLAPVGGTITYPAESLIVYAQCKIRGSIINSDGFTIAEEIVPIQGTIGVLPVPGDGMPTNNFFILNATLQHEDNQDLAIHLDSYKNGTWASNVKPMTHRPNNYKVMGSDYFPINHPNTINTPDCIRLYFTRKDGTTGEINTCGIYLDCPLLSITSITPVNNNTYPPTQTFTFVWSAPFPLWSIDIQYTRTGQNNWQISNIYPVSSPQIMVLPLGKYDFRFEGFGPCNSTVTAIFSNYGIDLPPCVAVSGTPNLPNAIANVPYNYSYLMTGTLAIFFSVITKPGWMNINVDLAGNIVFTGTPLFIDIGIGIAVSVDMWNACTFPNFNYSDTLTVESPVQNPNSWIKLTDVATIAKFTLLKNNLPSYIILNPQPLPGSGVPLNFYQRDELLADIQFLMGDDITLSVANLYVVGTTITYPGTISPGQVIWNSVVIVDGMQITLTL